jgi:hypothetical protein
MSSFGPVSPGAIAMGESVPDPLRVYKFCASGRCASSSWWSMPMPMPMPMSTSTARAGFERFDESGYHRRPHVVPLSVVALDAQRRTGGDVFDEDLFGVAGADLVH